MTTAALVEKPAQPRFRDDVAFVGELQVGPRFRQVCGRTGLVLYRPAIGVVLSLGPHPAGEGVERGVSGRGGRRDVHVSTLNDSTSSGERS